MSMLPDYGWGFGILLWLTIVWAVILVTAWAIFHTFGGPRHHIRH